MKFEPSPFSYGQPEATALEPAPEAPASTSVPAAGGGASDSYLSALPLVGGVVKQILGVSDDPKEIQAKIENYQRAMASAPPSPGGVPVPLTKNWYANEINKLQAKLRVAEEQKAASQLQQGLKFAAIIGGVMFIGGLAVNQIMRARVQQAELARLRGDA